MPKDLPKPWVKKWKIAFICPKPKLCKLIFQIFRKFWAKTHGNLYFFPIPLAHREFGAFEEFEGEMRDLFAFPLRLCYSDDTEFIASVSF